MITFCGLKKGGGGARGGGGTPPYWEKLYHTPEKQGKIKGKGEKSGVKGENS